MSDNARKDIIEELCDEKWALEKGFTNLFTYINVRYPDILQELFEKDDDDFRKKRIIEIKAAMKMSCLTAIYPEQQ